MDAAGGLNLVLFLPLVGAIAIACFPRDQHGLARGTALGVSLLTFLFSLSLLQEFKFADNGTFQLKTEAPWIPQFGVQYKVGVDGISLALLLLTTLLSTIAIFSSFTAIHDRVKEYYACLLALETGMLGVFASLDLILFYVFWEAMLIPMYFLIGIWGGPNRAYATIKFVLYTLVGSLLMLVAIIWVYMTARHGGSALPGGGAGFDLEYLTGPMSPITHGGGLAPDARLWLFLAFAAAFAIKVPMWPFHTWLPDAHVEAPTAGSVILAGVLLKMGTYGFLRYCIPLFPDVALKFAPYFLILSVIGIIYGALVAYVQPDIKRLVAYSSVSHLGFCVLGLFAFTREAVAGSILQMINHGLSTGGLFLIVGMIYERRHTREISAFGGLWKVIPIFGLFFLITTLSSVGLPGLNGFVGEFLILLGTWGVPDGAKTAQWAAVLAATGVILGAVYMLWMFQRVMQGPLDRPENQKLKDLSLQEIACLMPLVIMMFWIGVAPNSVLGMFDQAVYRTVIAPIQEARAQEAAAAPAGGMPTPTPSAPGAMPDRTLDLPSSFRFPPIAPKGTPDSKAPPAPANPTSGAPAGKAPTPGASR
jgi:NADH-quinone oxidoreductase subunit M